MPPSPAELDEDCNHCWHIVDREDCKRKAIDPNKVKKCCKCDQETRIYA